MLHGPAEQLLALAAELVAAGLALRALAFDAAGMLLVELAGLPAVLDRQAQAVATAAARYHLSITANPLTAWQHWEALAHQHAALPLANGSI